MGRYLCGQRYTQDLDITSPMFELRTEAFGRFQQYHFFHPRQGHGFSVVPGCGATLLRLRCKEVELLDGYASPEALEMGQGAKSALLFPFPNRLRDGSYRWLGKAYRFPIDEPTTQTAIHGFAYREPFVVARIELTKEHAEITCLLDYDGHCAGYPFPVTIEVTYSLTDRGLFGWSAWIKNRHTEPIPVGLGWHPYFRVAERVDACVLRCPPCERELLDERQLPLLKREAFTDFERPHPIGSRVFDDCFRLPATATLCDIHLKGDHSAVRLSFSRSLFPFFQLFTPPDRRSIAVEPMSCLINAFENGEGLRELAPGSDWSAALVVQCEAL